MIPISKTALNVAVLACTLVANLASVDACAANRGLDCGDTRAQFATDAVKSAAMHGSSDTGCAAYSDSCKLNNGKCLTWSLYADNGSGDKDTILVVGLYDSHTGSYAVCSANNEGTKLPCKCK